MSLIYNLQKKPLKKRERILWIGTAIIAIGLFSFLIWQQKQHLSSTNLSPQKEIPKLELPQEEIKRLKGSLKQMEEIRKKSSPTSEISEEELQKLKDLYKGKDLDKLSEEEKKVLEELV